ncbi:hypothetical protein [Pelagibius sp. Alg239-R121]|uniref:hypothetical protein n=1 Tax=Pelagibius sp. Alg239-R121 TaxID=2993448 RepID=UPI0024A63E39|nr:hypothetical protein [Pelagibius sp. Alg239-R121]
MRPLEFILKFGVVYFGGSMFVVALVLGGYAFRLDEPSTPEDLRFIMLVCAGIGLFCGIAMCLIGRDDVQGLSRKKIEILDEIVSVWVGVARYVIIGVIGNFVLIAFGADSNVALSIAIVGAITGIIFSVVSKD